MCPREALALPHCPICRWPFPLQAQWALHKPEAQKEWYGCSQLGHRLKTLRKTILNYSYNSIWKILLNFSLVGSGDPGMNKSHLEVHNLVSYKCMSVGFTQLWVKWRKLLAETFPFRANCPLVCQLHELLLRFIPTSRKMKTKTFNSAHKVRPSAAQTIFLEGPVPFYFVF